MYGGATEALGHLPVDDIPLAALRALESGYDSLTMAMLAGEPRSAHPADLRDAFEAALRELAIELPSRLQAAEYLKQAIAADACREACSAQDAARTILDVYDTIENELPSKHVVGGAFDIADLVGAFYALDDSYVDPAAQLIVEHDLANALRRLGSAPR